MLRGLQHPNISKAGRFVFWVRELFERQKGEVLVGGPAQNRLVELVARDYRLFVWRPLFKSPWFKTVWY